SSPTPSPAVCTRGSSERTSFWIKGRLAERQGFEPWEPSKGLNGFRNRPDQPLRHLSVRCYYTTCSRSCNPRPTRWLQNRLQIRNRLHPLHLAADHVVRDAGIALGRYDGRVPKQLL